MSKQITVIYTDDTKPRRFISSTSRRDGVTDNKLLAELSTNRHEAKDFGSIEAAQRAIKEIHNPHERRYLAVELEVAETVNQIHSRIASLR